MRRQDYPASSLLIMAGLLLLLSACRDTPTPELPSPRITATPTVPRVATAPSVAPSATAVATETSMSPQDLTSVGAEPSPTPSPTVTATAVALGPFAECPVDVETATDLEQPMSLLVYNDLGAWRWAEEEGAVTALPLPKGARSPVPSQEGDRVAYTLEPEEGMVELWVMDADGANRRQLTTVSVGEYLATSPEYVVDAALSYRWIADRELVAYEIVPVLGALGLPPLETMMVADVISGQTWTLVPGGEFFEAVNHPHGDQVATLNGKGVQLIDVTTGEVQHEVSLPLNDFWFSADYAPDGDSLVAFTEDGVALVDTATGDVRNIPFAYEPIGMGEYALMPPIHWLPDGQAFYTVVAEGDDAGDILGPRAQFTVWRVDVAAATVERLQAYQGSLVSVTFSPDRRRLAFWSQDQDNVRTLYLADLVSAEQVAYDRRHVLEFLNWHPVSAQFVYWEFTEKTPLLGHLCEEPEPLAAVNFPFAGAIYWLGPERYVSVEGVDRGVQVTGPWDIHLRTVGGEDLLLHTVEGAAPRVQLDP